MKKKILEEIIIKKKNKVEFAIITNLENSESFIYEKNKPIHENFKKYSDDIKLYFNKKKNGVIEGKNIFIESYIRPIKVVIVGAVHIAQYLVNFVKHLTGQKNYLSSPFRRHETLTHYCNRSCTSGGMWEFTGNYYYSQTGFFEVNQNTFR